MKNDSSGIAVANAPISYGAFEVTIGFDPNVPDGEDILANVAMAGYDGIDLGPVGYLGTLKTIAQKLARHGLGLAGGYLELPYSDVDYLASTLPELDAMLDIFDSVKALGLGPDPRPTLADRGLGEGANNRRNNPGIGSRNPATGYTDAQWGDFAKGMDLVVQRCRSRGYTPVFHHETGSYVESPAEIAKVLELTEIDLCLDVGHFLLSDGDPIDYIRVWGHRVSHVHVKSADLTRFSKIVSDGLPTSAIWDHEVFPKLGEGALDIDGFLEGLRDIRYSGWLVVEQDILPSTAERFAQAAEDQLANRRLLRERGL